MPVKIWPAGARLDANPVPNATAPERIIRRLTIESHGDLSDQKPSSCSSVSLIVPLLNLGLP
jgi:hypothetical protein